MKKKENTAPQTEGLMGLEEIIKKIQQENAEACRSIEEEAELQAANRLAYAQTEAEKRIQSAKEQANAEALKQLTAASSQGKALVKRTLLQTKSELIDQTLEMAREYLHNLSTEDYFKMLYSFVARSRQEGEGVLYLNQSDLQRMPQSFLSALGSHITVSQTPIQIDDGFILVYGEIEMNYTLGALFHTLREDLREKAAAVLFEGNL